MGGPTWNIGGGLTYPCHGTAETQVATSSMINQRKLSALFLTTRSPPTQCCHSMLTSFPYTKNEKSLHFPTQSETKNEIIFSYNIWPWNTTYYIRCIIETRVQDQNYNINIKQVYRKHHCLTTCQFFFFKWCLLRLASTFGNKSKHNPLQLSSWLHLTRKKSH